MTLSALMSTWMTSCPVGAPYTGVRSWDASQVPSPRLSLWPGSWSTRYSSSATSAVAERRRNPSEIRSWAGRQKRRHRTVLAGWDRAARRRAQQRGRERAR